MQPLSYVDFDIRLERAGTGYTAHVTSQVGDATGTFAVPFTEEKLELLVLKLGRTRSRTRAIHSDELRVARELGGRLFEAVFTGDVKTCFRASVYAAAVQENTGLRVKLRLQDAPELGDLPWEFLLDGATDGFLAQSNQTPVVRYIDLPDLVPPLRLTLPLRLLVMVSSPIDHLRLDVEQEERTLRDALAPLVNTGKVEIDVLHEATLAELQRALRRNRYHVFHFIGHGGFNQQTEEGVLVLEDEREYGADVSADRIGAILRDHRSLRLAFLNSCEGARNSKADPFAGVATTLVRRGIPAVVAMQFEITDEAAITFAREFYAALADGFPVDGATSEARKAIYAQPNDTEWATPVLYMRTPNGVIFELADVQPIVEPPRQKAPEPSIRDVPLVLPVDDARDLELPGEPAVGPEPEPDPELEPEPEPELVPAGIVHQNTISSGPHNIESTAITLLQRPIPQRRTVRELLRSRPLQIVGGGAGVVVVVAATMIAAGLGPDRDDQDPGVSPAPAPVPAPVVNALRATDTLSMPAVLLPEPPFPSDPPQVIAGAAPALRLELQSQERNDIIDDGKWFQDNALALPLVDLKGFGASYIPRHYARDLIMIGPESTKTALQAIRQGEHVYVKYGKNYSDETILAGYNSTTRTLEWVFDFRAYTWAPGITDAYTDESVSWVHGEGNVLYVSHSHSSYSANSGGMNAYITALDITDPRRPSLLWRSAPLVCNARNFEVVGDYIICGYGYTQEKDFLFILDRRNGSVVTRIPLRSGPDYIIRKDNQLFVRTYDTNYLFTIIQN